MTNKLKIFILLTVITVRLILSGITIHPDFRAVNYAGLIISKGNLLDFYDIINIDYQGNYVTKFHGQNWLIYPPLAYVAHGAFRLLNSFVIEESDLILLMEDIGKFRIQDDSFINNLLLKLPYLISDIITAFVLSSIIKKYNSLKVMIFYLINPISVYTSSLMGQFDTFVSLGIALAIKYNNSYISSIIIGITSAFKPFTLILSPFFGKKGIYSLILCIFMYSVIIFPYLSSQGFRSSALVAGLTGKIMYSGIYISQTQKVSLVVGIILLLVFFSLSMSHKSRQRSLLIFLTTSLLIFFSFTNFHPQWFMWFVPVMTLIYFDIEIARKFLVVQIVIYLTLIMTFENSLHVGMFNLDSSIIEYYNMYLKKLFSDEMFNSILRTAFASINIFICYLVSKEYQNDKLIKKD